MTINTQNVCQYFVENKLFLQYIKHTKKLNLGGVYLGSLCPNNSITSAKLQKHFVTK
jgi:hypothetical protein